MTGRRSILCTLLFAAATWAAEPDGGALYRKQCAVCHESPNPETRAPDRRAMGNMTAARIVAAMETGSMKVHAAALSAADRRAIAAFLSTATVEVEAKAGFCAAGASASPNLAAGPRWNGWSPDPANTRFQPASMAGLSANQVPRLKVKWAFGYAGSSAAEAHPTVAGGRLLLGSPGGEVYLLDAATGCIYWSYKATAGVRAAINVDPAANAAYFGDLAANVYAVNASTGALLWKTKVDDHPMARVTGSPRLHQGRLYVPVSSVEEVSSGNPKYECCKFRGSVVALDVRSGRQIWKTYTIPDPPTPAKKKESGVQLYGPSGAAVWSAPTLDLK
ncbi:MAG: PQQ-binding-like beta-propeller repeat protein, partial [Acidobacteria bacterium]|nr:PQQ-binding-like beta-propeller repeat protein [Acidobacteriota bacterium]